MLVSTGLVVVVGGIAFLCLHAGVRLFGKNVAVNVPASATRHAFDLLQRDLHCSIAEPVLIDAALAEVPTAGPTAGIAIRFLVGGPTLLTADTAPGATNLSVERSATFEPRVGDQVSLPAFRIERTVASVTDFGSNWLIGLDSAVDVSIADTGAFNYTCLFSRRCAYVVQGEQLVRYPDLSNPADLRVITRGVINPTPFAFPSGGSTPDRRFVAVNLAARDPASSNRGWAAVAANLNFLLGVRTTAPLVDP